MSVGMEHAQEGLEHAHHEVLHGTVPEGHGHDAHHDPHHGAMHNLESHPRQMAVVIAALAACLAIAEIGEKSASSDYITRHINVSDTYAFLQAKNIRAGVMLTAADTIESLHADDEATKGRVAKLRAEADRLLDDPKGGEGRKQLLERAHHETELRDHANHKDHLYEFASGALQIAIVLCSVSIVTRSHLLSFIGGGLGALASVFALAVAAGIF